MTIFRIIPANDIAFTTSPLDATKKTPYFVRGPEYVKRKIAARLKFFLGEWFLDQRLGVPWIRDAFTQNPDLDIIRSIFRTVILGVQEVATLDKLNLTFDRASRSLAVEFNATLVAGGELLVRQPDPPFIIEVQRAA